MAATAWALLLSPPASRACTSRQQQEKMDTTLARHEKSLQETKAVVYNTQAAANSLCRQIQVLAAALPRTGAFEETPSPPRAHADLELQPAAGQVPREALVYEGGGKKGQDDKLKVATLRDGMNKEYAQRRGVDSQRGIEEGNEDVARREGGRRVKDGTGKRPLQVPALDWNKAFELVGAKGRGPERESLRNDRGGGGGGQRASGKPRQRDTSTSPRGSETLTPRTETLRTESQLSARASRRALRFRCLWYCLWCCLRRYLRHASCMHSDLVSRVGSCCRCPLPLRARVVSDTESASAAGPPPPWR